MRRALHRALALASGGRTTVENHAWVLLEPHMSVSINNREVEALLAEIEAATGKETSRIVLELLREEARRLRRTRGIDERRQEIDKISRRYSARVSTQPAAPDAIIGYDEWGLPG